MNAERLRNLVEWLLDEESRLSIQDKLNQVVSSLENLGSNPQEQSYQTALASNMAALSKAVTRDFYEQLTPAVREHFIDIGAWRYFSDELHTELGADISTNAMTPAVAAASARRVRDGRQKFLDTLRQTRDGLAGLGIQPDDLEEGDADIAFLIPRDLFHNHLGGLSKEFSVLDKIVRIYSEAVTGSVEEADVKTISTTDPVITLAVSLLTIQAIGKSVTWLLDTWKKSLEIKSLRQQAKDAGFNDKELKVFDDKIERAVNAAITEKVGDILAASPVEQARKNELEKGLDWSLRALLSRIERGMSVEIRLLPPARVAEDEDVPDSQPYAEVQEIARQLVFPKPTGEPVLSLPEQPPEISARL